MPAADVSERGAQLPATAALTTGAALGAAAGLLELVALGVRWWLLHKPPFTSPQVVWTAPLADALLGAAATALMLLLGLALRPLRAARALLAAPLFLGVCSIIATSGWLSAWAAMLLAAGVSWQLGGLLARSPAQLRRWSQWGLAGAVLVASVLAAGVNGERLREERRASAGLPPASTGAPNVLVLVLDAVRASSLNLYGYARPTSPELSLVAGRGVLFERAFAAAPWTLPSHASMFTGRGAYELNLGWTRPWQDSYPTLAEVFSARGYRTAGFVGNLWYADRQHGLARGFQHYEDYPITPGSLLAGSALLRKLFNPDLPVGRVLGIHRMLERKDARRLDGDFLRWAAEPGDRPFFAFINYVDAHDPYDPPARFAGSFGSGRNAPGWRRRLADVLSGRRAWDLHPDEGRRAQALYEESIAGLDAELGGFFRELDRRGLLQHTVLVVTSDHGEEFGTHGHFTHGSDLYLPVLHVPLIVLAPGAPAGRHVTEQVSLRDLAATLLELAGISGGGVPLLPGQSLVSTWRSAPTADSARGLQAPATASALKAAPPVQAVLSALEAPSGVRKLSVLAAPYHFLQDTRGRSELYRLDLDPDETVNLARDSAHGDVVAGLRALLPRWSVPAGARRPLADR